MIKYSLSQDLSHSRFYTHSYSSPPIFYHHLFMFWFYLSHQQKKGSFVLENNLGSNERYDETSIVPMLKTVSLVLKSIRKHHLKLFKDVA